MIDQSLAHTAHDVDERIREDAARHPERAYRQHVEAAEEIAAVEYRRATRAMMAAGALDPEEEE